MPLGIIHVSRMSHTCSFKISPSRFVFVFFEKGSDVACWTQINYATEGNPELLSLLPPLSSAEIAYCIFAVAVVWGRRSHRVAFG